MKEKFSDMGEYHDPELRLERTDIAQQDFNSHVDPILIDTVVKQLQIELEPQVKQNPNITVNELKLKAMYRFLDLINQGLLSSNEANKCYQRFAQMLDFYYGS